MVKSKWDDNILEKVINDNKVELEKYSFEAAKKLAEDIQCPICGKHATVELIDGGKIYYDYCHKELELLMEKYLNN